MDNNKNKTYNMIVTLIKIFIIFIPFVFCDQKFFNIPIYNETEISINTCGRITSMTPVEILESNVNYWAVGAKLCDGNWYSHAFHWKTIVFSGPSGFPTSDKTIHQDQKCDASDRTGATLTSVGVNKWKIKDNGKGWSWGFEKGSSGNIAHMGGNYCTVLGSSCTDEVTLEHTLNLRLSNNKVVKFYRLTVNSSGTWSRLNGRCANDNNYLDQVGYNDYVIAFFKP